MILYENDKENKKSKNFLYTPILLLTFFLFSFLFSFQSFANNSYEKRILKNFLKIEKISQDEKKLKKFIARKKVSESELWHFLGTGYYMGFKNEKHEGFDYYASLKIDPDKVIKYLSKCHDLKDLRCTALLGLSYRDFEKYRNIDKSLNLLGETKNLYLNINEEYAITIHQKLKSNNYDEAKYNSYVLEMIQILNTYSMTKKNIGKFYLPALNSFIQIIEDDLFINDYINLFNSNKNINDKINKKNFSILLLELINLRDRVVSNKISVNQAISDANNKFYSYSKKAKDANQVVFLLAMGSIAAVSYIGAMGNYGPGSGYGPSTHDLVTWGVIK